MIEIKFKAVRTDRFGGKGVGVCLQNPGADSAGPAKKSVRLRLIVNPGRDKLHPASRHAGVEKRISKKRRANRRSGPPVLLQNVAVLHDLQPPELWLRRSFRV